MQLFRYPDPGEWPEILARPDYQDDQTENTVKRILLDVKSKGDEAIRKHSLKFDGFLPEDLEINDAEFREAEMGIGDELKKAISLAMENITAFHTAQLQTVKKTVTSPGVECWQKAVPIERVGLYVPGGTAPLFSTVLMLAIPARLAGCKEEILC